MTVEAPPIRKKRCRNLAAGSEKTRRHRIKEAWWSFGPRTRDTWKGRGTSISGPTGCRPARPGCARCGSYISEVDCPLATHLTGSRREPAHHPLPHFPGGSGAVMRCWGDARVFRGRNPDVFGSADLDDARFTDA